MRYTSRDIFWLIIVAALFCGWAVTYKVALDLKLERDELIRSGAAQDP